MSELHTPDYGYRDAIDGERCFCATLCGSVR